MYIYLSSMIISVVYLFLFISNCVCILYIYVLYERRYCIPHIYSYIVPHQRVCNNIERKKILINTICLAIEIHREPRVSIINLIFFKSLLIIYTVNSYLLPFFWLQQSQIKCFKRRKPLCIH